MPTYVLIPAAGQLLTVDPGSAIVASDVDGDQIRVDYEGNRYGAINMATLSDRVLHAADRHHSGYPTTARAVLPAGQLRVVGTFDADARRVLLHPGVRADVCAWLGVEDDQLDAELGQTQ